MIQTLSKRGESQIPTPPSLWMYSAVHYYKKKKVQQYFCYNTFRVVSFLIGLLFTINQASQPLHEYDTDSFMRFF